MLGLQLGRQFTGRSSLRYKLRLPHMNNPPSQPQWQDYVEIDLDAPETQFETQYECIVASLDSGGPSLAMIGGQWRSLGAHEGILGDGSSWGSRSVDLRLSQYKHWIDTVIHGD